MRKFILWLILSIFISGLALEAAQPAWTPVRARRTAAAKKKRIKKRHHRRKKAKKRKHRRKRKLAVASPASGSSRGLI
jgi:hypothetical protein